MSDYGNSRGLDDRCALIRTVVSEASQSPVSPSTHYPDHHRGPGGRRELQRELEQGRAAELSDLAQKIAARHQIDLRVLRRRAVSAARHALARAAVVERGIRPVEVSWYLGGSGAAITAQLRVHDT